VLTRSFQFAIFTPLTRSQICECRGKKRRKTGRQITPTGNLHQYAYEFGQIARSKNQLTIHKARAAKKYHGNIEGNVM
jgi:hypothetical protein